MSSRVHYVWCDEHTESFHKLCTMISEHVMLSAPRGSGPFVLICDASNTGIGSALAQVQGHEIVLLEFASRRLTDAEKRWDTREREAFAIKWSVQRFQDYIRASHFYIVSDHESLMWMDTISSAKVQRWILYLQQYSFTLLHISGSDNHVADWLSRSLPDDEQQDEIIDAISIPAYPIQQATAAPRGHVAPSLPQAPLPTPEEFRCSEQSLTPAERRDTYLNPNDGLRYHVHTHALYAPMNVRDSLIFWFHAGKFGGHLGVGKTARRLKKWLWWTHLAQDVRTYINSCLICLRLQRQPIVTSLFSVLSRPLPLQLVSMDYVGPLERDDPYKGTYVVIIDHASRFMFSRPALHEDCADAIAVFRDHWLPIFQAPNAVLTDGGSSFQTEFSNYFTRELGAYHTISSPYYPQGNGINEASHKAINRSIAAYFLQSPTASFSEALSAATAVHNSAPHSATGQSPFYQLFGFEPCLPGWQAFSNRRDVDAQRHQLLEQRYKALLKDSLQRDNYRAAPSSEFARRLGGLLPFKIRTRGSFNSSFPFNQINAVMVSPRQSY